MQLNAELDVATVKHERAKTALKRTTYLAPVTGRVVACDVEVGDWVQVGHLCGEVYATDKMEVPVSVPGGDLRWLDADKLEACERRTSTSPAKAGHIEAEVLWVDPDPATRGRETKWSGCLDRVEAGVARQTRTATLGVPVTNPPRGSDGNRLDLNMYCRVTVFGKTLDKVFVLPRSAILPGNKVYVVNGESRLEIRALQIARFCGEEALILPDGGIREGDRVVLSPVPKAVRNMRLEVSDRPLGQAETAPASKPSSPTVK